LQLFPVFAAASRFPLFLQAPSHRRSFIVLRYRALFSDLSVGFAAAPTEYAALFDGAMLRLFFISSSFTPKRREPQPSLSLTEYISLLRRLLLPSCFLYILFPSS